MARYMGYDPSYVGYDPALAGQEMGWGWQDVVKTVLNPASLLQQVPVVRDLVPRLDPVQAVLNAALPSPSAQPAYRPQPPAAPMFNWAQWQAQIAQQQRQAAAAQLAAQRAAQQQQLQSQLADVTSLSQRRDGRQSIFQIVGTFAAADTSINVSAQPLEGLIPQRMSATDFDGTAVASAAGSVSIGTLAIGSILQTLGTGIVPFALISSQAFNVLPFQLTPIPTSQIVQANLQRTVAPGAGATRIAVLGIQGLTA